MRLYDEKNQIYVYDDDDIVKFTKLTCGEIKKMFPKCEEIFVLREVPVIVRNRKKKEKAENNLSDTTDIIYRNREDGTEMTKLIIGLTCGSEEKARQIPPDTIVFKLKGRRCKDAVNIRVLLDSDDEYWKGREWEAYSINLEAFIKNPCKKTKIDLIRSACLSPAYYFSNKYSPRKGNQIKSVMRKITKLTDDEIWELCKRCKHLRKLESDILRILKKYKVDSEHITRIIDARLNNKGCIKNKYLKDYNLSTEDATKLENLLIERYGFVGNIMRFIYKYPPDKDVEPTDRGGLMNFRTILDDIHEIHRSKYVSIYAETEGVKVHAYMFIPLYRVLLVSGGAMYLL